MRKKTIYQPTSNNGIDNTVNILRKSSNNRLSAMIDFCKLYFGEDLKNKTFLDLGCSSGFFMHGMKNFCKSVTGIEGEDSQILLAEIFYNDISSYIIHDKIEFQINQLESYDIVAFLSVIHSMIMQESEEYALSVLKDIDNKVNDILFFEMAQEHEEEYDGLLVGWNPEKIKEFITTNTSLKFCKELYVDEDSVGEYEGSFGRTLFAFYRKEVS